MATRRDIIEGSLRLHSSLRQWRQQCEVVAQVLKQEGVEARSEEEAESQEQLVQQLRQIGEEVLEEAGSLMEMMVAATQRPAEAGGGGEDGQGVGSHGNAPDYSTGIGHVKRLTEEVEKGRVSPCMYPCHD